MSDAPPLSVLVVDDDPLIRHVISEALHQEGFQVFQAPTGEDALRLVRHQPSVVILDVHLPDISGFEVCRRIKMEPATTKVLVLLLSGYYIGSADRIAGLQGGADSYLVKPVTATELLAEIKALLRIRQAERDLADSQALYHSLVETLPVCIFRKDCQGRFSFANQTFCAELNLPLAEIVGKTVFDLYPAALARKYSGDDQRVIESGEFFEDVEQRPVGESGKSYVRVLKAPLRDSQGETIGMQGIFYDITDRKLREEESARAAMEMRIAQCIQQRLFPKTTPQIAGKDIGGSGSGYDIGGASYPAEAIGGDYYDYLDLREGCLGIAIGDVSGHGIGPALLMAEIRAYLRAFAQINPDPGRILNLVNRVLVPDIEGDQFITLLLARLQLNSHSLTYASAGQSAGYIFKANGDVKQSLPSRSIPLGITAESHFLSSEPIHLDCGDLVLFLTDGVLEARAPDDTSFGIERTIQLVRHYRRVPACEIVENLYHAVRAFSQNQPQEDDITATVIKVGA